MAAELRLPSLRFIKTTNEGGLGLSYTRLGAEAHQLRHRAAPAAGRPAKPSRMLEIGQIEAEVRRALARDLHDGVAQTLTLMIVQAEIHKSEHADQPHIVGQMRAMQDSARDVLSNLRQLVYELRGEEGVGGRFVDALDSLLARYEQQTGIVTKLTIRRGWPETLLTPAAANLRSLIEEALANARRHSCARSVSVVLERTSSDRVAVTVSDDGRGLEGDFRVDGLGMTGMRERAILLGGRLSVEGAPGKGTRVRASFPLSMLSAAGESQR